MPTDPLRRTIDSGVSNVEIDWFLRGKLPASKPASHHHSVSPTSTSTSTEPTTLRPTTTHSIRNEQNEEVGHALSRTRSLPAASSPAIAVPQKKKGFFKSIFGKKKEEYSPPPAVRPSSPAHQPQAYHVSPSAANTQADGNTIHRSKSLSVGSTTLDPKLEEFLRYYKAKGLDKLQKDTHPEKTPSLPTTGSSNYNNIDQVTTSSTNSTLSSVSSSAHVSKSRKYDVLGRPIPPHPATCELPSALAKSCQISEEAKKPKEPVQASKLGFLRRHVSSETSLSRTPSTSTTATNNTNKVKPVVIPGLENLPILKRVAFDMPVFFNDPPQQIPSRTPRKGEVEILKDGTIVIHKLTAAEKKQILTSSGGGLVVGGSGPLKIISKPNDTNAETSAKLLEEHMPTPDELADAQKHSIEVAAKEAAAGARAKEAPNELRRIVTNHEEEVNIDDEASRINIDKPLIHSNKSSSSIVNDSGKSIYEIEEEEVYPARDIQVPLDVLYTRCCHLREILPIPATAKQLKAGSSDPLSLLQLRNPKPSLVEVLTFSDFISVAPILCISLDGVSLSTEMLRIILSSLAHRRKLEKLTLRNTQLDETGWKLLCWFLTKNETLSRLDLTQVPSLVTNVQKPSKTAVANVARMEGDNNSRSDMNWNLLSAALLSRGGIDEIVISGAKMSDEEFKTFIEMGTSIKTTKLGLAYNDLTDTQCKILADNIDFQQVIGLDLGYNDLSGKINYFIERIHRDNISESNLKFISLNSSNLQNKHGEMNDFISSFARLKDLRYIDLSNNKDLFPSLMDALTENLPLYENLARIHLDYNDLSQEVLVAFSELIPFCKNLTNISLIGNKLDNVSAGALTTGLRLSKSVISLDINYDEISPKFREQIALYTVRNMQHQVYGKEEDTNDLKDLQEQISHLLRSDEKDPDPSLVSSFLERATKIRKSIHETIDDLFKLRIQGELNTEGKEALIRFCFIDSSIEKGLKLLEQKSPLFQICLLPDKKVDDYVNSTVMTRGGSNSSIAVTSTSTYLDNSHTELMPFGVSNSSHDIHDHHDDTEELKDDQLARSADNLKLKEEASALKIGRLMRDSKLSKDFDEEKFSSIKDSLNEDQLKNILLETSDLDNVVDIIDNLKKKGISVSEIYKKDEGSEHEPIEHESLGPDIETLNNTNSNITRSTKDDQKKDDDSDTASDTEDEMDQAYDEILDHLVRVRTNN